MISLVISLLISFGYAYSCPETMTEGSKYSQAHQWLKRFEGVTQLGECNIEVIRCNPEEEQSAFESPIAEFLIEMEDGREAYFQLLAPDNNEWVHSKLEIHSRSLWVEQKNKFYEEENGKTEVWRFEAQTFWGDKTKIKKLELGVYTTNSQLNQENGNDSHWFICKEKER